LFTNRSQAIYSIYIVRTREALFQHISMHSYIKEIRDYKVENSLDLPQQQFIRFTMLENDVAN